VAEPVRWRVAGSYFEACNCEAVCPCRRRGDQRGDRSTYGICDFALSWLITDGVFGGLDLSRQQVVMAGSYDDDEPDQPWRIVLYIDDQAERAQHEALSAIFLGRAGGGTLRNFASNIGEVYAVRAATILLTHSRGHERIEAEDYVRVAALHPADVEGPVSCGIPGHDHPGTELVTGDFHVNDVALRWEVTGRCGFATQFAYASDDGAVRP
jgi:hypothetical protein